MVEKPLSFSEYSMRLYRSHMRHHVIEQTAAHRKSHCDIYIPDIIRNGIQNRFQQVLIRQDHCAFCLRVLNLSQYIRQSFRLTD